MFEFVSVRNALSSASLSVDSITMGWDPAMLKLDVRLEVLSSGGAARVAAWWGFGMAVSEAQWVA